MVHWYADEEPVSAALPIELVAHHLRRLAIRLTEGPSHGLRYAAAQSAYDHYLRGACLALHVIEHLSGLTGVDLAIERVRVEGRLEQFGLALRHRASERAESS